MNVASLELCKELYELSGWDAEDDLGSYGLRMENGTRPFRCPAYGLSYLLRKLPDHMHSLTYEVTYRLHMSKIGIYYFFEYSNHPWFRDMKSVFTRKGYDTSDDSLAYGIKPICDNTPEGAACKLAIELFKQDILKQVNFTK